MPNHAAPGDRALMIGGQTGGAVGATMAGTCQTCERARPLHEPLLTHLGTSLRGRARQSVPGPGTSR